MLREGQPNPPIQENKVNLYTPSGFLIQLHATISDWMIKDQKGNIVDRTEPQIIDRWDSHQAVDLNMDLFEGIVVKTHQHNIGLVLGHRRRNRYENKTTLSLQFGLQPQPGGKHFEELSDVDKLRLLTNQSLSEGAYGSAEFYLDSMTGNVRIRSWADGFTYGGQEVNRWKPNKLLTDKGINACLEIVQRTAKNAFV